MAAADGKAPQLNRPLAEQMKSNWKKYQGVIEAICNEHLKGVQVVHHLHPEDNYVWRIEAEDGSFILKINPQLPYRLHREEIILQLKRC